MRRLFLLCMVAITCCFNMDAQWFTFSGGYKYLNLRDIQVNTASIEIETVNAIGSSFMFTMQFGRDFISINPIAFVGGCGIAINNNRMIKAVNRLADRYNIDKEEAYEMFKDTYEYKDLIESNKYAALLGLAGPFRFAIPVGKFYMGPSWSLCNFTKIYDRKWEITGDVGFRVDYCPIPQLLIGAYGEYRYGWKKNSPYKGYSVGVSIGYRIGNIYH